MFSLQKLLTLVSITIYQLFLECYFFTIFGAFDLLQNLINYLYVHNPVKTEMDLCDRCFPEITDLLLHVYWILAGKH